MPLFAPCSAGAISSAAMATSCIVVFHFASRVTGTLTCSSARNSRRPETKISRMSTMIAAQIDQCRKVSSATRISMETATSSLSAIGSSMRPSADCCFQARARYPSK